MSARREYPTTARLGPWFDLEEPALTAATSTVGGSWGDLQSIALAHNYNQLAGVVRIVRDASGRGSEHGSGLGVHRWVVEQTFALLHWFRRMRIRWEIRDDIHEAFLSLACAIICWHRLRNLSTSSAESRWSIGLVRLRARQPSLWSKAPSGVTHPGAVADTGHLES